MGHDPPANLTEKELLTRLRRLESEIYQGYTPKEFELDDHRLDADLGGGGGGESFDHELEDDLDGNGYAIDGLGSLQVLTDLGVQDPATEYPGGPSVLFPPENDPDVGGQDMVIAITWKHTEETDEGPLTLAQQLIQVTPPGEPPDLMSRHWQIEENEWSDPEPIEGGDGSGGGDPEAILYYHGNSGLRIAHNGPEGSPDVTVTAVAIGVDSDSGEIDDVDTGARTLSQGYTRTIPLDVSGDYTGVTVDTEDDVTLISTVFDPDNYQAPIS